MSRAEILYTNLINQGGTKMIEQTQKIREEAFAAAAVATNNYIEKYLDGEDKYACGFAWVTVYPKHKGNTKAGREERIVIKALGLEKDWTGKAYMWWNPSQCYFQNIDCKEEGAKAAATVLKAHGFDAYAGSRLD
jgi:hypothetical protein